MIPKIIIGIGHRSGVGKDTLAKFITGQLRCQRPRLITIHVSLAWKLKDVCHQLYEWAGVRPPIHYENHREDRNLPLPALGGMTVVDLWVKFGTLAVRQQVYMDTWIDFVIHNNNQKIDVLIVSDIRQYGEVDKLLDFNSILIRVDNPNVPHRQGESIDDELADYEGWHQIYCNDGSLRDIMAYAEKISESILRRLA